MKTKASNKDYLFVENVHKAITALEDILETYKGLTEEIQELEKLKKSIVDHVIPKKKGK